MILPVTQKAPKFTKEKTLLMMDSLSTCPLKNSGIRVVHPIGDGSSGIFLIGEAPGAKEDKVGEPFVGASGKFLNGTLLTSVGLSRKNIYLTNIVKCRPPENRDPTDEEKAAWSPVLMAEIIALKPKLIVCLGRHSLSFFLPEAKIGEVHGKIQKVRLYKNLEIEVLPLYHPAVALYNPNYRKILIEDFSIIKPKIDEDSKTEDDSVLL